MSKISLYILEFLGLMGIVGLVTYITWTKMALGSVLTLLGAFFPKIRVKEEKEGHGTIKTEKVEITIRGELRFVVVFAGIILIVGSVLDGHEGHKKNEDDINNSIVDEITLRLSSLDKDKEIELFKKVETRFLDDPTYTDTQANKYILNILKEYDIRTYDEILYDVSEPALSR